jgi:hypothetical protein
MHILLEKDKALTKFGGEPLEGSGFEDEAAETSFTNIELLVLTLRSDVF